jgi:hypothetical protein
MAGTSTITEERHGSLKKIKFEWTSDAGGTCNYGTTTYAYNGALERVVFVPDSGGTQPDNLFDVTILDADGYDVLAGQGADLSNADTTTVVSSMGAVANDPLHILVTGAGSANAGDVYVYLR